MTNQQVGAERYYGPIGARLLGNEDQLAKDLSELGVVLEPGSDPLPQLICHATHNWLGIDINAEGVRPVPHEQVPAYAALQRLGLTEAIKPPHQSYDVGIIDGGTTIVFDLRLGYLEQLRAEGLQVPEVVLFAGQRPRLPRDGNLEDEARGLSSIDDPWLKQWIASELAKPREGSDIWQRSFATEHEVAIMALLRQYGPRLRHEATIVRSDAASADPAIPIPSASAEVFAADGLQIVVMNARAVRRELNGLQLPPGEARPTGASCFGEWLDLAQPSSDTSILLISNQPNTERTLYDLRIVAHQAGLTLPMEYAAGPIEAGSSYGRVLSALARMAMALYELRRLEALAPIRTK